MHTVFIRIENGYVIDSTFEEEYEWIKNPNGGSGGWYGMFRVYEDKRLSVAANMAVAFKYWSKTASTPLIDYILTIQDIIEDNKKYNPIYEKYAKDIEKYLLLI